MKNYFILFMVLFILGSCYKIEIKRPEPEPKPIELPPVTQEGKNTFGFLLNGEVWLPRKKGSFTGKQGASYYMGKFKINATREDSSKNINQSFVIHMEEPLLFETRIFKLGNKRICGASFWDWEKKCAYETDSINTGRLIITKLDEINQIVAGTFEITFVSNKCDTVSITDGRFDMKF